MLQVVDRPCFANTDKKLSFLTPYTGSESYNQSFVSMSEAFSESIKEIQFLK